MHRTVTITVAVFIAWGTAYDIVLRRKLKQKLDIKKYSKDLSSESSVLNCTTYDLTQGSNEKKNTCGVGIGLPTSINNNNSDEHLAMDSTANDEARKLCKFEYTYC